MKYLAFILTTFILFLVAKPGIDELSLLAFSEHTCCGEQCTPTSEKQEQQQDDDCNGKPCNPFQVCSSSVLVCLNIPFDFIYKPLSFQEKGFTYHSAFTSQFASDFWQPPKIVYNT